MTLKISFFKLARDEWKKLSWLTALQGVVLGLLIPLRVLLSYVFLLSNRYEEASAGDRIDIFCANMGLDRWENGPVILGLGVVCALCAFTYLHFSAKLDLYHSLPVTRTWLFGAKYLGSVMTFVTAYLICQLLGLLVGVCYGGVTGTAVWEVAADTARGILFFLCSYSAALLAVMLTGKMLTTVCVLAVFLGYGPLLILIRETFQDVFLFTNMIERAEVKATLAYSSPWAFCLFWGSGKGQTGGKGLTGTIPTAGGLCQLVALAALLSFLALFLYRLRRTEAAGTAIAFPRLEGVLKILLAVPASLVAAVVTYDGANTILWEGILLTVIGALCCAVIEFIYRWDIRQALTRKYHMVIAVAIGAALYFSVRCDVFGYNTYLPKQEELRAMSVMELWSGIGYETEEMGTVYGGSRQILDRLESENVAALYPAAEDGVKHARENESAGVMTIGSYVGTDVCVKYVLKSGREVYRAYTVDQEVLGSCLEAVFQNQELRKRYYPVLDWQPEEIFLITYHYSGLDEVLNQYILYEGDGVELSIPQRWTKEVLAAYQRDLESLPVREIWDSWDGVSSLYFERKGSGSEEGLLSFDSYPMSEKFTETMSLIREITKEQYEE